ncbi:hypothetical protein H4582DRAFT_2002475, partial [Lactarius indigo]
MLVCCRVLWGVLAYLCLSVDHAVVCVGVVFFGAGSRWYSGTRIGLVCHCSLLLVLVRPCPGSLPWEFRPLVVVTVQGAP